ncbi:hypothetical protein FA13DRAFT_1815771 [Coprinellus micaceus]|uniref:Uncharacterized protein n=1 Tax=Coprinellus micaceus TaxID=71717 RepID=A0A4Y7T3X8_COPMI|nr:hypothetical protein FA13DRAFT_1815771 [Coprinellus micaceus]
MRTDRQHISLDIRLNLNKTRFPFPLSQNNLLGLSLGIMNGIVVERLQELSRLKERVDADLEAAELLSLTGAAIGPRYPKLLNAKEILDKAIPELEAALGAVEINSLAEGEAQALRTGGQSRMEGVEKRLNEIIPEKTLSDLRSLETSGVLTSPNAEVIVAQSELDIQTEMSPEVQAAAESFREGLPNVGTS